jgi:hypothetical protein
MPKRTQHIAAVADSGRVTVGGVFAGVASVGTFQVSPPTERPFKINAVAETDKLRRTIVIALTDAEAAKLVSDFRGFGVKS